MTGALEARALASLDRGAALKLAQAIKPVEPVGVRLIRGDAVILEAINWLWPGFLPAGVLTLLGGAPGCGKTTIALSVAATISSGGMWPDGSRCGAPGDVIIWSGEDAHAVAAARLVAMGADMSRIHFIDGMSGTDGDSFDPARDMLVLEATADKLPAPRLLILDPIVSAVSGDGHKGNDVRRNLQPVVTLAQRLRCAVLGITHFSKGTSGRDPVERITGSHAFAALARLVLVAAKERGDDDGTEPRRVLVRAKSNISADDGGFAYALERKEVAPGVEGQLVVWGDALEGSARSVLSDAEADTDADGDSVSDVEAFVRSSLSAGPVAARVFETDAKGAGHQWRTVQRTAKRLGAESRKEGMKDGWRWGFYGPTKATRRHEGDEDASPQSVTPLSPSPPCLSPSDESEVL